MTWTLRHVLPRLQVLVLGVALWAFVLLLPERHVGAADAAAQLTPVAQPLFFLPLALLLAGVLGGRSLWLVVAVPLGLLPPLLAEPALLSAEVYGFPAFLLTAAALAGYLVAALRLEVGPRRPAAGAGSRPAAGLRELVAGGALMAAVAGALALFAWWAGFDPAIVWTGADAGNAPATRAYGRTVPALVLIACWLALVTLVLTPLAAGLAARTGAARTGAARTGAAPAAGPSAGTTDTTGVG